MAGNDSGIDTVHTWAYPMPGPANQPSPRLRRSAEALGAKAEAGHYASPSSPIFLGADTNRASRPDVGVTYGAQFTDSGFNIAVTGLAPGTYDIVVYPHSVVDDAFVGAQVVRVIVR